MVDRLYRSCVMTFTRCETLVDLIILDIVVFLYYFRYGLVSSLSCYFVLLCQKCNPNIVGYTKDNFEEYS